MTIILIGLIGFNITVKIAPEEKAGTGRAAIGAEPGAQH